jgi:hypothetical protein
MRALWLIPIALGIASCGHDPSDAIVGVWHVDGESVKCSALPQGGELKPDWADAKATLRSVELHFLREPHDATLRAFGHTDTASWRLLGHAISFTYGKETWPQMTLDATGKRIHASLQRVDGSVEFDFVR